MLEVEGIHSYYGKSHILTGVSLRVGSGELVTLLGRNGAGKTTTLKSIVGVVPPRQGSVRFEGEEIAGDESFRIARRGVCLVPETRDIFAILTVEENLRIAVRRGSPWGLADVYRLFPRLEQRRRNGGGNLSGGEQQMLAIARALVNGPRMLLLDEPTEGLAPVVVREIVATLKAIKKAGIPMLLVEQNIQVCEQLADRHYVLEQGAVVYQGTQADFAARPDIKDRYLALKTDAPKLAAPPEAR
jgi:branched-chain amino acid transport system ATP-binding protein